MARRPHTTPILDLVAAVLIPGFVFWLLFWLGKQLGYDVRGLSNMVGASSWLDVGWYAGIAEKGYWLDPAAPANPTVFFPLWPALIALARRLGGLATATEAAFWLQRVVAVVCCFSILRYARAQAGDSGGETGLDPRPQLSPYELALFMFLQPAAIYLVVPYPECLYLCLLCWALIVHRGIQEPPQQGIAPYAILFGLSFLLGTCRPNGLFLGLAAGLYCAYLAARKERDGVALQKAVVVGAGSVAAFLAVAAVMYAFTGQAFSFLTERAGWNEHPGLGQLVSLLEPQLGGMRTMETIYVYFCLGGCVLLCRARRRFEAVYCLLCVLLPAYQGKAGDMSRYGLAAMPALVMAQGRLARHRFWYVVLWTCSCSVAVQTAFKWFAHRWPG